MSTDKRLLFKVLDADHFLLKLPEQGVCGDADPDLFLSESKSPNKYQYAKALCQRCPLKEACLDYAIETRVVGVWGGTDEVEREKIRKEARRQARLNEEKEQEIEH